VTDDYASHDDSSSGPLTPGDVGVIERDDRDSKPFNVRLGGRTWFYPERALRRTTAAPAATAAAVATGTAAHSGEWRGDAKKKWCSLRESLDGLICAHPGECIIFAPHWSCCGSPRRGDICAAAAAPEVAVVAFGNSATSDLEEGPSGHATTGGEPADDYDAKWPASCERWPDDQQEEYSAAH
jgi:hypothetical protein